MAKIKIGVIGAGNMGRNHIRLVSEMVNDFEFKGVYDPAHERLKTVEIYNPTVFKTVESLMDSVDAVIIAAPSSLHLEIALKAAKHGLHALVEKPLALTASDASIISDAYSNTGKVLMVGHIERFNPVVAELQKIVKDEHIVAINMTRCSPKDKRISDADVIQDLMIHDIDILVNALNPASATAVFANGRIEYSKKFLDYAQSLLTFDNGVVASITASRITEEKIREIAIHARRCLVRADLLSKTLLITRSTSYKLDTGYTPTYRQENVMERIFIPSNEPLRMELSHFAECIRTGKTPITSAESAVRSLIVLEKISKAAYSI